MGSPGTCIFSAFPEDEFTLFAEWMAAEEAAAYSRGSSGLSNAIW